MNGQSIIPKIVIRQNDLNTTVLSVQVTQNGLPFDFTGFKPVFECITPSKTFIRDDGSQYGTMNVTDATHGKFEYTIVKEVFANIGTINVAYFAFEEVDSSQNVTNRVTTGNFSFTVIADALTGNVEQSPYMSDVETMLSQMNQLADVVPTSNYSIFYEYNADGTIQSATIKDSQNNILKTTTFAYDPNGNLTATATVVNGTTVNTEYNYDANGQISSLTVSTS
jgi:YD repeat-containing protein